jgi:hypothetical protein
VVTRFQGAVVVGLELDRLLEVRRRPLLESPSKVRPANQGPHPGATGDRLPRLDRRPVLAQQFDEAPVGRHLSAGPCSAGSGTGTPDPRVCQRAAANPIFTVCRRHSIGPPPLPGTATGLCEVDRAGAEGDGGVRIL